MRCNKVDIGTSRHPATYHRPPRCAHKSTPTRPGRQSTLKTRYRRLRTIVYFVPHRRIGRGAKRRARDLNTSTDLGTRHNRACRLSHSDTRRDCVRSNVAPLRRDLLPFRFNWCRHNFLRFEDVPRKEGGTPNRELRDAVHQIHPFDEASRSGTEGINAMYPTRCQHFSPFFRKTQVTFSTSSKLL
jgi:hypothetical protein